MIKVSCELKVYEVDGREVTTLVGAKEQPKISLHSHWNRTSLIILEFEGKRLAVNATDLEAAIRNAQNSGQH